MNKIVTNRARRGFFRRETLGVFDIFYCWQQDFSIINEIVRLVARIVRLIVRLVARIVRLVARIVRLVARIVRLVARIVRLVARIDTIQVGYLYDSVFSFAKISTTLTPKVAL